MENNSRFFLLRRSFPLFIAIFMISGSIIGGLMMFFYQSEIKIQLSQLETREDFSNNLQSKSIDSILGSIAGDLLFLSRQNELQEYLGDGTPAHLDDLAHEYLNLASLKKIYDQIRLIGENGMEVVRVNYNQGRPGRVPADQLQSKKHRYYFKECFALNQGEVYVSPLDLNIEHARIEQPLKPMIRLGTPVFDASGRKRGIVLFNYQGADLLAKLTATEQLSVGRTMLLNADGYWLLSPDHRQEWGFMYGDKESSFAYLLSASTS